MDFKKPSTQFLIAISLCFTGANAQAEDIPSGEINTGDNTNTTAVIPEQDAGVASAAVVADSDSSKDTIAAAPPTEMETTDGQEIEFSSDFVVGGAGQIDLSRFAKGNPTPPGTYTVNIFVNDRQIVTTPVTFIENGTPQASPCLTADLIAQMGIDSSVDQPEGEDTAQQCADISKSIPGASVKYDNGEQRLDVAVPQKYLKILPKGYVDPSLWDEGVNAAMLSYDANYYRTTNDNDTSESAYAGLNYGLNIGAWRFRARGSLNWDQDEGSHYDSQDIYVQRDITPLKAQLVLGDSFTSGETFDSVSIKGVRLYSDDRMLPTSMNGYAPVVRGVANTNAKVTIRQNGSIISQTTVPPGAFEITDLNPTGYGSELDVTVEEADGSERTFKVPFSSVVQLLRPGISRWDFAAGQFDKASLVSKPNVAQATYAYGLNNTFTLYTGLQATDTNFHAGVLGVAMNTALGAFAFDVTQSSAEIPDFETQKGQSYRISYSKLLEATDTSLNVAAYRYSTSDYMTLSDAVQRKDDIEHDPERAENQNNYRGMRSQFQVNVSQPLGSGKDSYGSVYLTGSWQNYWGNSQSTTQYSAGYSNSISWASYSISMQRSYDQYGTKDDSLYLSVSIPLANLFGGGENSAARHPAFDTLNLNVNSDLKGSNQNSATANGSTEDNRFSYGVNTSYNMEKEGKNLGQFGGYGTWNSSRGPVSASASIDNNHGRQFSVAKSGGVVLHSGGLTFASGSINDTESIAIINAPGATGARVTNGDGRIDGNGYAISDSLSPYRENNIGIDISTLESDVEVQSTSAMSVPRAGAVVRLEFETEQGQSVLMNLSRTDNGFIPLGAVVYSMDGKEVGSVGQAGQAFIRGIDTSGQIKVVWGNTSDQRCIAPYALKDSKDSMRMTIILDNVKCTLLP